MTSTAAHWSRGGGVVAWAIFLGALGGANGCGSSAATPGDGSVPDIVPDSLAPLVPPNTWTTTLPPVPQPRFYNGAAAAGGKLYIIGGTVTGAFDTAPERLAAHAYDPASNTWAVLPDLPIAHLMANVAGVGDQLFIVGCLDSNKTFLYDAANQAWVAKKPMPTPSNEGRGSAAVGVSGTKILVAGGVIRGQSANMLNTGMRRDSFYAYDTATDEWETLPSLPVATGYATGALLNQQLWVMGGSTDFSRTDQVLVFDIATSTWDGSNRLPIGISSATSAVIGGRIYVTGGIATSVGRISSDTLMFDPTTMAWATLAPLPTPRFAMGSGVINGELYVPSGTGSTGENMFGALPAFESFHP